MPVGALADRQKVAAQITHLADEPGLASRRDELRALAKALLGTGDGDVEPWTELDLVQAFARPESVHHAARTRPEPAFFTWLEAGIGALVFVPLLLTWFGLTKASSAYEALAGADPKQAARPFLQLWQTGFEGHLTGWFTFGHVAGTATLSILLLLVLAAVHGARRAHADRAEEAARRNADDLLARLVPVLTRAQLLLNEERLGSPGRFAAELTKAAATLNRLVTKAAKVQQSLETAAEQVGEAVGGAERRLAGVDSAVRPLEEAAVRIETAVRDGDASLTRTLGEVHTVSGEIRDRLERAGERVEDAVTTLAASQRSFTTSTEVAADLTGRALTRLDEVAGQTARAVTTSQDAAHRLAEQTDALRTAAERFAELAALLREPPAGGRAGDRPGPGDAVGVEQADDLAEAR
ncbi:MAG TPA: methyl-accepting chemotaxis protein [Streptomyces sp.]|uniref:methyl-accepting chemotaxis protein n=1 Tax=Streptomyces sp. TaxID=1931 RepID=UPI002D36394D|nr:methyl-accepting chemotaxis protein [Streptomyces sp.]HZG04308.1 methyl-accepting chemotaxis protein [Streptomyces sp.]